MTWVEAPSDVQAQPSTGYVTIAQFASHATLPSAPAIGDVVRVSGFGAGGGAGGSPRTGTNPVRNWHAVASSSNGTRLVSSGFGGQIHTSNTGTTPGGSGSIHREKAESIELQYLGNNVFVSLSSNGELTEQ